ncbi:MAG: preprotein translocase subunit SecE [Opitutales bacterium]
MQKKKPAEKKKKSRESGGLEANGAGSNSANLSDAVAGQGAGIAVKQKKQKSGSSSGSGAGRTGLEQTVVVRFLDRYFGDWIQFLREVKVELSKVTWPSRKETVGTTVVVLVFVIILAIFLGAADFILTTLVQLIL